jgi:hypothetical protein
VVSEHETYRGDFCTSGYGLMEVISSISYQHDRDLNMTYSPDRGYFHFNENALRVNANRSTHTEALGDNGGQ